MSRFDVNKFNPSPDPELICGICKQVLDKPKESPCRHVFCEVCIKQALREKPKCPLCRANLKQHHLKDVLPLVQNMLNRLPMTCDNFENGCTDPIPMECFINHLVNCDFVFVTCKFSRCGQNLLKRQQTKHETEECMYRDIPCKNGCDLMIAFKDKMIHNCFDALKSLKNEYLKKNEDLESKVLELNSTIVKLKKQLEEHKKDKERSNAESTFEGLVELPDTSARTNSDIGSPIPPSISSWNSNMYDDYDDYYTDISDLTYNEDMNPDIDLDDISAIENDPIVNPEPLDVGSDFSDNNMGSPVPPFSPDYYSEGDNEADVYHYETEVGASEQVETEPPLAEPVVNNDIPSGHSEINISNEDCYFQEDGCTGSSTVDSSRVTSGSNSRKRTFLHGGTTIGSVGKRRQTTASFHFRLTNEGNDIGETSSHVENSNDSSDADDEEDVPVRRSRRLLNQEPSPTGKIPCVNVPVPASYLLDAYANGDTSDDGSWSPSKES